MVVEEGGEAWKEGDPWPPVQSDNEEEEEAEEAKPSWHIRKLIPKSSWTVIPKLNKMGPKPNKKTIVLPSIFGVSFKKKLNGS